MSKNIVANPRKKVQDIRQKWDHRKHTCTAHVCCSMGVFHCIYHQNVGRGFHSSNLKHEKWKRKLYQTRRTKPDLFLVILCHIYSVPPPPKKTNKLLLFSIPLTSFPTREHFRLIVIVLVHDDPWVIWFVTVNNEIPALRSNTLTKHQPVKKIRFVLNTKKLSIPNYVSSNAIYCDFI